MASPSDRSKRGRPSRRRRDDGAGGSGPPVDGEGANGAAGNGNGSAGEDFGLGSLFDDDATPIGPLDEEVAGPQREAEGSEEEPRPDEAESTPEPDGAPTAAPVARAPERDAGPDETGGDAAAAEASPQDGDSAPDGDEPDTDGSGKTTARQIAEQRAAERRALKESRKDERRKRRAERPRLRKLRFVALLIFLAALAFVSWVFGVMMAVAGDLPDLEARAQYDQAENSTVTDRDGKKLVTLTGNEHRILLKSSEISPLMKQAVVSIEDQRFYEHRGIDWMGMLRAIKADVIAGGAVQGGSTITQQFVKNALAAQQDRTVLEKLREAALAYQIERHWSKDKILTNYLNNIYFGNGAYGIEAAARTYFGANHPGCGDPGNRCASDLRVDEAAMLAGMISSPTAYDPATHPRAAEKRRNVVLEKMREQGVLEVSDKQMQDLESISAPAAGAIKPPSQESSAPFFTDWLRQQIVDMYGPGQAFGGGLEVESTLDSQLQSAAQSAVQSRLGGLGPTSAVVVIENGTGKVRAMVGGMDYNKSAFNIATDGQRQPGSSFKPFTLVTALQDGISPDTVYPSKPVKLPFKTTITKHGKKKRVTDYFRVSNYDDNYLGSASLATATTYSDNSVYAQVGMQVGPENVAKTANKLGVESKLNHNPAIILGGLKHGVTPLEMAYAYSTLANDGDKISGTMASEGKGKGPVAIESVKDHNGKPVPDNLGGSGEDEVTHDQVIDPAIAKQATDILHTVVTEGTGRRAQVGDDYIFGKTGTTDNNADAWFVGSNGEITLRGLGRLPGWRHPDGDRVRRPPGRRRHDPGGDLLRRRRGLGQRAGRPARRQAGKEVGGYDHDHHLHRLERGRARDAIDDDGGSLRAGAHADPADARHADAGRPRRSGSGNAGTGTLVRRRRPDRLNAADGPRAKRLALARPSDPRSKGSRPRGSAREAPPPW